MQNRQWYRAKVGPGLFADPAVISTLHAGNIHTLLDALVGASKDQGCMRNMGGEKSDC